ncbi:MAG TPA: hypothetical protein VGF40_09570 [Thermoanaerobaculia bacterium]
MRIAFLILSVASLVPAPLRAQNVLTIQGGAPTLVGSAEGGFANSDVVEERLGPSPFPRKHLAGVRYEPLELSFSPNQCTDLFDMIDGFLSSNYQRKDGELLVADARGRIVRRLRFYFALLESVTLPGTGTSGDPAAVRVSLAPEFTRLDFPGGRVALPAVQSPATGLRAILALDGLPPADVVTEPITITRPLVEDPIGEHRDYEREPGSFEIPNLTLGIPESALAPFLAWYEDFVIRGNNGQDQEKNGALAYQSANGAGVLTIEVRGAGIHALRPLADGSWEIGLYAEEVGISNDHPCPVVP